MTLTPVLTVRSTTATSSRVLEPTVAQGIAACRLGRVFDRKNEIKTPILNASTLPPTSLLLSQRRATMVLLSSIQQGGTTMARSEVIGSESSPADPSENRDAYSISEFCRRHGISHGTYYNLKSLGLGPREGRAMKRVLISRESAASWRKKIEATRSYGK
jgi:hypothetical protein